MCSIGVATPRGLDCSLRQTWSTCKFVRRKTRSDESMRQRRMRRCEARGWRGHRGGGGRGDLHQASIKMPLAKTSFWWTSKTCTPPSNSKIFASGRNHVERLSLSRFVSHDFSQSTNVLFSRNEEKEGFPRRLENWRTAVCSASGTFRASVEHITLPVIAAGRSWMMHREHHANAFEARLAARRTETAAHRQ